MAAPHLDSTSFSKLYCGQNKKSHGTVRGTGISGGFPVKVTEKNGNKVWEGTVDSSPQNPDGSWNATVTKTHGGEPKPDRNLETVSVTVTNLSGQGSNTVDTQSDVVP